MWVVKLGRVKYIGIAIASGLFIWFIIYARRVDREIRNFVENPRPGDMYIFDMHTVSFRQTENASIAVPSHITRDKSRYSTPFLFCFLLRTTTEGTEFGCARESYKDIGKARDMGRQIKNFRKSAYLGNKPVFFAAKGEKILRPEWGLCTIFRRG